MASDIYLRLVCGGNIKTSFNIFLLNPQWYYMIVYGNTHHYCYNNIEAHFDIRETPTMIGFNTGNMKFHKTKIKK